MNALPVCDDVVDLLLYARCSAHAIMKMTNVIHYLVQIEAIDIDDGNGLKFCDGGWRGGICCRWRNELEVAGGGSVISGVALIAVQTGRDAASCSFGGAAAPPSS